MTTPKLEYWGDFWLESVPERRVAGHLTFDPKRGGQLLLHGSLNERLTAMSDRQNYDRIVGQILGRSCVLLDCFDVGGRSSEVEPGKWESNLRIFVNAVLLVPRRHSSDPAVEFARAGASFDGLAEFDGRNPFKSDRPDPDERSTQTLTARQLDSRTVETDRATIELHHGTGFAGDGFRSYTLTSHNSLHVVPREPLPLNELVELYSQVRTLVALSMHRDCRLTGPLHLRPELRAGEEEGDAYLPSYEYHAVWRRGRRDSDPLHNRILSFESLGPEGIARWLSLYDECGHVIARLSSLRYTRLLGYEDALLRLVAAADSLHRVLTGIDRERAETVLTDLAEYAHHPFLPAVADVDEWATAVIAERHNAAHNKGQSITMPTLTTELVESVYFLVLICLLRRADAPESAFESVRKSEPFRRSMHAIFDQFGGDDWLLRMGRPF